MQIEREEVADVERLRESLKGLPEPVSQPCLVLVGGLPASGKSYFSRHLAQQLPAAVLESDALRKALVSRPTYSWQENRRLFQACHQLIGDLLRRGIRVIFDATNLQEAAREQLYRVADRAGAKLVVVWVEAPPEVVWERMGARQRGLDPHDQSQADWEVYRRLSESAEPPRRNFFRVDTSQDITEAIQKIVRAAKSRC